jgi:hypothetical protein
VRVHCPEAGTLSDGPDPTVCGPAVAAFAVTAAQDWTFAVFADGQVDRSRGPWGERDGGGLVAEQTGPGDAEER